MDRGGSSPSSHSMKPTQSSEANVKDLWSFTFTHPIHFHDVVFRHTGNFRVCLLFYKGSKACNFIMPMNILHLKCFNKITIFIHLLMSIMSLLQAISTFILFNPLLSIKPFGGGAEGNTSSIKCRALTSCVVS